MPGRVTFKAGAKAERIQKNLKNPARALKQIGVLMVAESQRAFKAQSFGTTKWEPRAPVNVFGIIADFHAGRRKPLARRFDRRPALRDTGRLMSSIAYEVKGDMVEVGTNLGYASVHQTGGEVESEPLTESVRRALSRWLKKGGDGPTRQALARPALEWVLNKKFHDKPVTARVPARPFVGITSATRKAVRRIIGNDIMEVGS